MVPHLFLLRADQRDGEADALRPSHSPHSMNVVFDVVRQREHDFVREPGDVDPPGRHVRANKKSDVALLERL